MLVIVAVATVLGFQVLHNLVNPFDRFPFQEQVGHACVNAAWNVLFETEECKPWKSNKDLRSALFYFQTIQPHHS